MNSHYENLIKKQIEEDCELISVFLRNMKEGNIQLSDAERLYFIAKNHFKLIDTGFQYLRGTLYKKSPLHEKSKNEIESCLKELSKTSGLYRFSGVRSNEIKSIYRLIR